MAAKAAGRWRQTTADPPERRKDDGTGEKYRAGDHGMEESAVKSAEWGGEETEEVVSEEEAETIGGSGKAERPLIVTGGESEESGVEDDPRVAAAGGSATDGATSTAADKAGARG